MARVLLVRIAKPSFPRFSHISRFISKFDSRVDDRPYGPIILARRLNKFNHTCHILDLATFMKIQRKSVMKKFAKRYDLIGFSFYTASYLETLNMAELCKRINPKVKIVFGGFHASFEYFDILKNHKFVDYVIIGEGENSIVDLANGMELSKIKGIVYRENGEIKRTECGVVDINSLEPISVLEGVKIFKSSLTKYMGEYSIETSRGCSVGCSFCPIKSFYKKMKYRDAKSVVNDMKFLMNNGVNYISISDSNFSVSFNHVKKICQEMKKNKIHFKQIFTFMHVDFTTKEMLRMMKDAGFTMVFFGVESLSPKVLKLINKTKNPESYPSRAIELLKYAKKIGLEAIAAYVVPFPGQHEEEVIKELNLLKRVATRVYLSFLTPYPGNLPWKLHKDKIKLNDLSNFCDFYPIYYLYDIPYQYSKKVFNLVYPLRRRLKYFWV